MAIDELTETPVPETEDEPTADASVIDDNETADDGGDDENADVDGSPDEN